MNFLSNLNFNETENFQNQISKSKIVFYNWLKKILRLKNSLDDLSHLKNSKKSFENLKCRNLKYNC